MSAYTKGRGGTTQHKIHFWTGLGVIIGLPFVLWSAVGAIMGRTEGLLAWASTPAGALGFLAFATAAIWYCKLEMDEVIMDYFDGGLRKFGLIKNIFVALAVWAGIAYALLTLAFL